METINNLLSYFTLENITLIISILFGVISTIAYFDQKRSNRKNKNIIKLLERHYTKELTEEEIEHLLERRNNIEKDITLKLLTEQKDFYYKIINQNYTNINEIDLRIKELDHTLTTDSQEDNKKLLLTKYNLNEKKSKIKDLFIILIGLFLVFSKLGVLGSPLQLIIVFLIILLTLKYLNLIFSDNNNQKQLFSITHFIISIIGLGCVVFFCFLSYYSFKETNTEVGILSLIFTVPLLLISIFSKKITKIMFDLGDKLEQIL